MHALVREHVIPAAYALLLPAMASREATAMLVAIGHQESRFEHRQQVVGPARGFWQFEQSGGVRGVLGYPQTRDLARDVWQQLRYIGAPTTWGCYDAIGHNDVLACCFARLLLWTVPARLPQAGDVDEGWRQYLAAWRPGKPHRDRWDEAWALGWEGLK